MHFGRKKRCFHSVLKRFCVVFCCFFIVLAVLAQSAEETPAAQTLSPKESADEVPSYPSPTFDQAREWYGLAKTNYLNKPGDAIAAVKFAEACFEWAEFARSSSERAPLALEGIGAAKVAVEKSSKDPGAHFFLAMNKGQLARTKTLGALSLVKEMETAFLQSIKLDAKFDNASAERSLGMLYLDAPGWPTSIGSKSKARKHLERAVELAPDYPTNLLELMDAYLRWEDGDALHKTMQRYRKLLPTARENYSGPKWQNSWKDWDARWKKVQEKSGELFSE